MHVKKYINRNTEHQEKTSPWYLQYKHITVVSTREIFSLRNNPHAHLDLFLYLRF